MGQFRSSTVQMERYLEYREEEKRFFRLARPYLLHINDEEKCYIEVNREFEYIGYENKKSLEEVVPDVDFTKWRRIYLYCEESQPWRDHRYAMMYFEKFNDHTKGYALWK